MSLKIGLVGCGVISSIYLQNEKLFKGVEILAVTDMNDAAAKKQAEKFGKQAVAIGDFWKRDDIQAIINLTVPNAHYEVTRRALETGRHVYSEKPLSVTAVEGRQLVEEAAKRGLLLSVAPDTILGPGHQLARRLVDEGKIGRVVAGSAFFMSRGMEDWHPDPTFFFKPGGGPLLDMGPYYLTALLNLIGPITRVTAMTGRGLNERLVTADGPKKGQTIQVETYTTASAILEFAQGALVTMNLSWDVFKHGHRPLEIYGTLGSLRTPDPNFFAGDVELAEERKDWAIVSSKAEPLSRRNHPQDKPTNANYRMLAVADLAQAVVQKRQPKMSGRVASHVLDVIEAIVKSAETGASVAVQGGVRPDPMSRAEALSLLVDAKAVTEAS